METCLRLMLGPRDLDYEIRDDGTIFVGPKQQVQGGYEREARTRIARMAELESVQAELRAGWDGICLAPVARTKVETTLEKSLTVPQGQTTINRELQRLVEEFQLQVHVDDPVDAAGFDRQQAAMDQPFARTVGEQGIAAYVDQLARRLGLTTVVMDHGAVYLTNASRATQYRDEHEQKFRAHRLMIEMLDLPVEGAGTVPLQEFLDSSRSFAIVPAEEVWDSTATVSLTRGTTLRQGLDQLKARGFRWAVRDGKLYVLR